MSHQGLRRRVQELANWHEGLGWTSEKSKASDLRELLRLHKKAKRELAIRRGIERELFALTEGMMDAQCPPWARGDEPEECPGDNCSKCWRKYFDGKLRKA